MSHCGRLRKLECFIAALVWSCLGWFPANAQPTNSSAAPIDRSDYAPPDWLDLRDVEPASLRDTLMRLKAALRSGDPKRISLFYEDATWFATDCRPVLRERSAVEDVWQQRSELASPSFSYSPESLSVNGLLAMEEGTSQLMELMGGIPFATNYNYLRVWRMHEGDWLIAVEFSEPVDGKNAGCVES